MRLGVFQMTVAGRESRDHLMEAISLLRNTNNPQVEYIMKVIRKWGKEHGLKL